MSRLGTIAMTPMEDLEYEPIRDILAGRKRQTLRPRRLTGKREITVRTQRTGIIIEFTRSHPRKRSDYLTDEFGRRDGLRDAAAIETITRRFYGEPPALMWENEFEVISAPAGEIARANAQGQMELSPCAPADDAGATGDVRRGRAAAPGGDADGGGDGMGGSGDPPLHGTTADGRGCGWGSIEATGGTAHRMTVRSGRVASGPVLLGRAQCGAFGAQEIVIATYARRLEVLEEETGARACERCARMMEKGQVP